MCAMMCILHLCLCIYSFTIWDRNWILVPYIHIVGIFETSIFFNERKRNRKYCTCVGLVPFPIFQWRIKADLCDLSRKKIFIGPPCISAGTTEYESISSARQLFRKKENINFLKCLNN